MKFLTPLLSLILAHVATAAEAPSALLELRQAWTNSIADADNKAKDLHRTKTIKANKLYYAELQQMKNNFMEAKNLEGAVAVNAEIEKLKALHGKQKFEVPKEEKPVGKKSSPLDGVWIHHFAENDGKGVFVFNGDKVVNLRGKVGKVSNKEGFIMLDWGDDYWHKLLIDPDKPDFIKCINNAGRTVSYTRLKW